MTKNGINISVSGGQAAFGNVSQGDNNVLKTDSIELRAQLDQLFDEVDTKILEQGKLAQVPAEEVDELKDELKLLKDKLCSAEPVETGFVPSYLNRLAKRYEWAVGLLASMSDGLSVMGLLV